MSRKRISPRIACLLLVTAALAISLEVGEAAALSPNQKRVLILGDSISIAYAPFVRELLEDEAVVVRPTSSDGKPENCDGTTKGVKVIDRWLQLEGVPWDVIHFNFGLHDLKRVDPANGRASNDSKHPRQAPPEVYERQLREIVAKLKATGARLIFATTTPVPKGGVKPHRDVEDVPRYNRIALRIMRENHIAVNDLYSLALPQLSRIQQPVNVHFTEEGSKILAAEVARQVRLVLASTPSSQSDTLPSASERRNVSPKPDAVPPLLGERAGVRTLRTDSPVERLAPLTRPAGTLSPTGGEGRGEGVRSMGRTNRSEPSAGSSRPTRMPSVIVILTDDQGTVDARCYGSDHLLTPAIDEIARHGVRFSQFYAAAPVCSPSRAALLTGRYPLRAGLTGNASSQRGAGPAMPAAQVTLAETFKAAGYTTAHVGKWHLGYTPETMPNAQGFDFSFGHMGGCIDNFSHFFYWQGPNRHDLWRNGQEVYASGRFFPDLMVEEATRFIEANQGRPFLLYFAMNTPHYPYQGEPCWLEHYRDMPYPTNLYAAFVTTLDARIRQVLTKLDALHLRDQTIIVFQSDNGHSTEERAHFGGGSAGPYRGAKFSLFEGGIRVPAILSWPGHLPGGVTRAQLAHGCDWLPTLTELCGVPLLQKDLDGRSLVRVIRSADAPSPHELVHWQVGPAKEPQWAVRQGDWKLLGNAWDTSAGDKSKPQTNLFLANLAQDPGEKKDFAQAHPEVVERLVKAHEAWVKQAQP